MFFSDTSSEDSVCFFFFSEAGVLIPDLVPKVVMLMAALPCKQATIRNGPTKKGRGKQVRGVQPTNLLGGGFKY